jgi:hypothetical protein
MTKRQREAICRILNRVGSWTTARFDQHLRWDLGDEDTNEILSFLDREAHIEFDRDLHIFITREEADARGRSEGSGEVENDT